MTTNLLKEQICKNVIIVNLDVWPIETTTDLNLIYKYKDIYNLFTNLFLELSDTKKYQT